MAEIINLRQARKRRARSDAEQKATENRVKFGRTKGAREAETAEARRLSGTLESARREHDRDDEPLP